MGTTFTRKPLELICPNCQQPLQLVRCKQPNRITFSVACDNYECGNAVSTFWFFTKEDAIKAANNKNWR